MRPGSLSPRFIDMLNHSETALIADSRSQGMIRQGVTLVVFGESSMGPINEHMKKDRIERQADFKFDITWTTLGQYLDMLAARGVSTKIASFVSAATVRENEVGLDNRPPTAEELDRMRADVSRAMDEGAMGLTTALIYIPGVFAKTDELVELAKVASASGGWSARFTADRTGLQNDEPERVRGQDARERSPPSFWWIPDSGRERMAAANQDAKSCSQFVLLARWSI
jgi:N-acyl-D-aspartate/D-glutamate deacylase